METRQKKIRFPRLKLPSDVPKLWHEGIASGRPPANFLRGYAIDEVLGSGTVAVVKRAVRLSDKQAVAVKCVCTADIELRQFAIAEYDMMKTLDHHAIVVAHELYADASNVWIVMELCEAGSLEAYRSSIDRFETDQVLALFCQLLEAVDYLHQKRIVHRDLKPANCLLQTGSVLKVTDFNSATLVGQGTNSGAMLSSRGTRAFFAPELVLGKIWNERIDIWTCGIIAYFMVCGQIPFNSEDPEVKECFLAGELPTKVNWDEVNGSAAPVRSMMLQCLAVDMQDRPSAMLLLRRPAVASDVGEQTEAEESWFQGLFTLDTFLSSWCECQSRSKHHGTAPKRASSLPPKPIHDA